MPVSRIEALESRVLLSTTFEAKINFQPDDAPVPSGCIADVGAVYGLQAGNLTYGWDRELTHRTRALGKKVEAADDHKSFIAPGKGIWEIELPQGVYEVTLAAGNGKGGLRQRVEVEGVMLLDDRTNRESRWVDATAAVTVSDGRLTVAPLEDFKRNKLVFIHIASSNGVPNGPPVAGAPEPGATPTSISWTEAGAGVRQTRVEAAVARVGTKLYVMGGYVDGLSVNRASDIFDAATGVWKSGPSIRGAQTHAGVASDGVRMIYKAGGQQGHGIPGTPTADAWRFDTADNAWTRLPSLPQARYAPGMAFLNDKLHVFGGTLPDRTTVTADHWILDLNAVQQGWQTAPALPEAGDHLSTVVLEGKIYAIGGEHGHATDENDGAAYVQHTHFFSYDPLTSAWTTLPAMPTGRSHAEGTTLAVEGKIVFMGGKLNPTDVSDRADLYDPATNSWTQLATLPAPNQGGAAIYHQGRMHLSHGQIGGPTFTMHDKIWVGTISFA